tara:strand:+ start:339 stop:620 length:282 start_codon:yes stop_codon:yes gene_type:complete
MVKILKFPFKKVRYSESFLRKVDPNKIGDFISKEHPDLSIRAADAMALAVIYSTYLSLVFEEEGKKVPVDVMNKFENNDYETFIWNNDPKTLH